MPEAPELVKELVEKFKNNLSAYKNSDYKEEQLKQEFINPFFQALGWDVDNRSGAAPQYRDVIFEDSIKVAGGTKAPDYCFTLAGRRMFFVEAKKPAVNVDRDKRFSYQLRRYGWSAKLPLSILTDFEEFAVYESRTRPKKDEKASTGRILYFTYRDYVERWDEIYNIFSKDAVLKGSFDRYAESTKKKRGTSEVDDAFLSEIENWRELFARNIALRNPEISIEELNFSVQKIIDRLIFLRMCEDRGAEPYEQLRDLLSKEDIYLNFCELCKKADEKYNSGLFHFQEEKGRNTPPDELTLKLKIDDGIFKTIIKALYYPNSPYEFSVLSPEILGNVYEQFLGKVIRLTKGHQAKVEKKPEVKKAGGVYYTPQFIVDYIVENTIGELCKGKTPNKVSKLKILDPACGSGSFLLGAYTYLLKWHRDYYAEQKDKNRLKDKIYQGKGGEWFLTIKEKKRILLNNIHGVDIDNQAVEVTKLSLLLKVLEGENKDALEAQQKLFRERALPDLGNNIKCGNSLIGTDIYNKIEFDNEDGKRINPFDWNTEFKDVMGNGGFDAIIGNPPYIRIQTMKKWAPIEVDHYKNEYKSASDGNYDIYVVFVEKGLKLLHKNGKLGFILPHRFFKTDYGENLRSLLIKSKTISKIIDFDGYMVFEKASINTCILILNKKESKKFLFGQVQFHKKSKDSLSHIINSAVSNDEFKVGQIPLSFLSSKPWVFIWENEKSLWDKLESSPKRLKNVTSHIFQGLKTSADKIYIVDEIDKKSNLVKIYSREKEAEYWVEPDLLHPLIKGADSNRYRISKTEKRIFFPYAPADNDKSQLIDKNALKNQYPLTFTYLNDNKHYLENRENGKMKGSKWYAYIYPKSLDVMPLPKIFIQDITSNAAYSLDADGDIYFTGGAAGGYGIIVLPEYSREFILGLLNSKLIDWYMHKISMRAFSTAYQYIKKYLEMLPIHTIDFNDSKDTAIHDKIVKLVDQMLQLNQKLSKTKIPNEKELIQRQIDATDNQIDNLVYELYGLTDDEIKIVEDSLK